MRLDEKRGATLVDLSTNGTRLNGRRVERGDTITVTDGDLLELGTVQLLFRDLRDVPDTEELEISPRELTMVMTPSAELAIVVGDIVGYTEATERDGAAVAAATEQLFGALRGLLVEHRGTVSNYVGDAIFAAWESSTTPTRSPRRSGSRWRQTRWRLTRLRSWKCAGPTAVHCGWAGVSHTARRS